jgi:oxygen-independent coproporphyrinogen-3 oxidase
MLYVLLKTGKLVKAEPFSSLAGRLSHINKLASILMTKENISIYIHIPFCVKKCHYCDFYSVRYDESLADRYILALVRELKLLKRHESICDRKVGTIFFGGGTPSILSIKQWKRIGELVSEFDITEDYEFSVECNPESFSAEKAEVFKEIGVTRLTFGVQSFSEKELAVAGRAHSATRACEILGSEMLTNFKSIGADLMYGLPGQSMETLKNSLQKTISFPNVKHISIYELSVSPETPFGRHGRIIPFPDEDLIGKMTEFVNSTLSKEGFEHYEVSNFAKPGFRSRHNEVYWDQSDYIGLGSGAHSYVHPYRWSNICDIKRYVEQTEDEVCLSVDKEVITTDILIKEMFFLGLRRIDGLNEKIFELKTGQKFEDLVDITMLKSYENRGWLIYCNSWWRVTERGLLFADLMARELI